MENESRSALHELIIELNYCNRIANKLIEILTEATDGNEEALQAPIDTVFRDLIGNEDEMRNILHNFCQLADLDMDSTQDRGGKGTAGADRHEEPSSSSSNSKKTKRFGYARRWLVEKLHLEEDFDSRLKIQESDESSSKDMARMDPNQETDTEIDIESLGEEEHKAIAARESKN